MTIVAAAARTAVLEMDGPEAFDPWADRSWAMGLDTSPLPQCAFVAPEAVLPSMHQWWDLSGGWIECCGCGILERDPW